MDLEKKCRDLLVKSLKPIPQELNDIDWKVTLTNKKERLKKHLSAFSNLPGGGFLVFGVNDNGVIVGIGEEDSRQIADLLANMSRTALDPQINVKFVTFKFDGHPILGVYIEESFEKPVHIKNKGLERSFIRAGGQSRLMSKEEVRRAIAGSRVLRFGEVTGAFSREVLENWEEYFDFSEVISRTRPAGFSDSEAMHEYLHSLKLIAKVNNAYVPTNLAILTCAKDFYKLHSYEKFTIRMVEYSHNTKLSAKREIAFRAGYSMSLDKIVNTLASWLPQREVIKGATRKTEPVIPVIVFREIIVNAIIHRDYSSNDSSIMIELYSDRVEVTSPGGLLPELSVDRLIDHPSRTRNEVFANFMRTLHFAEERGSGIDKAVIAMEANGLPPIHFTDGYDYFRVCIFMEKSYNTMDREERIDAIYQHACLNTVIQRRTTGRTIRERFKLTSKESAKVYRLIDAAVAVGKIKLANPGSPRKDQHYLPYWV